MSLYVDIQTERQSSLGKDRVKYNILGVVIAEIQRKITKGDVPDSTVLQTIKKLVEGVDESLKYSTDEDKTAQLVQEKEVLLSFLPKQLSDDELIAIMKAAISSDPSLSEQKKMFPYLKANYDGQYNGKTASTLFSKLGE